jgi:putative transcriptional regulator
MDLAQLELAKKVGVSRQTIYYLERGDYNPSLDLSLKLAKVLDKKIEDIFYFEPIINDLIGSLKVNELDEITKKLAINPDKLLHIRDLTDDELSERFTVEELIKISEALGYEFEDLFIKE